jgi:hypothetical protein
MNWLARNGPVYSATDHFSEMAHRIDLRFKTGLILEWCVNYSLRREYASIAKARKAVATLLFEWITISYTQNSGCVKPEAIIKS